MERATGLDRSFYRLPVLMLDDFSQVTPELVRQVRMRGEAGRGRGEMEMGGREGRIRGEVEKGEERKEKKRRGMHLKSLATRVAITAVLLI
jgi:hypothetical protein